MGRILDSFINTIGRNRARLIKQNLKKEISEGRISDRDEYNRIYQAELVRLAANQEALRYPGYNLPIGRKISSVGFNECFEAISEDLQILFLETQLLYNLGQRQSEMHRREITAKLENALTEAEAEIERVQFLHKNYSSGENCIIERFNTSLSRLQRGDRDYQIVYRDPKVEGGTIPPEQDVVLDYYSRGIEIPRRGQGGVIADPTDQESREAADGGEPFALLPIHGSPSTRNDVFAVDFDEGETEGDLSDITDGDINTFWIKRVRKYRPEEPGAKLNIRLDFGGDNIIDELTIVPKSNHEFELSSIYYTDNDFISKQINLPEPVKLNSPVRIRLPETEAKEITLIFTQKNFTPTASPNGTPAYEYGFGFNDISVNSGRYRDLGFYASRTLEGKNITEVSLGTTVNSTVGTSPDLLSGDQPLVEYYLFYRDTDRHGSMIYSKIIPILPRDTTTVKEKLVLRDNGTIKLSFRSQIETLKIRKSSSLLVRRENNVGDWFLGNPDEPGAIPYERPDIIQFMNDAGDGGEIIVEYTPFFQSATAGMDYSNDVQDVLFRKNNTIEIIRPEGSRATKSSLNLIIILRAVGDKKGALVINNYKLSFSEVTK